MKIAFSSNAYLHFPVEAAIERIARLGYAGIEILADVPHAWPAGLLPQRKESMRRKLAQEGLAIANVNAFMMRAVGDPRQAYWHPGWIDPDPHYRAIRREHTKRALILARELGAPSITTEPGGPLAPGQTWDEAARIFYEELMPCVEVAEELGVALLIEPEPGLMIERFEQYRQFVDRLRTPAVGLNFDIGHAFCVGQEPEEWIPAMAADTRHYHVEDIAASRIHEHMIPGHGAIDLAATMSAIHQTGYDGWMTVELYPYVEQPDNAAREAYQFLTATATRLGIPIDG